MTNGVPRSECAMICSGVLSNATVSDGGFSDKRVEHFLNVPIDKMALLPRLALVLPKPGPFTFFAVF